MVDEHTRRAREERAARHRMLTIRDHIIGLEASVASAQARVIRSSKRARFAERRARRYRRELEEALARLEAVGHPRSRDGLGRLAARLRQSRT